MDNSVERDKRIEEIQQYIATSGRIDTGTKVFTYIEVDDASFLLTELSRLQTLLNQANKAVIAMATENEAREQHVKMMEEFDSRYRHSELDFTYLQQELEKCNEEYQEHMTGMQEELSRLQVERDKAIEGLRWYANKHNYVAGCGEDPFDLSPASVIVDGGDIARDTLSELGVPDETT